MRKANCELRIANYAVRVSLRSSFGLPSTVYGLRSAVCSPNAISSLMAGKFAFTLRLC
jgi:hypothetical protein